MNDNISEDKDNESSIDSLTSNSSQSNDQNVDHVVILDIPLVPFDMFSGETISNDLYPGAVNDSANSESNSTDPSTEDYNIIEENTRKVVKYKEINNYIKGEKIGKGSFARVREFIDKKSLKRVAGKIMEKGRFRAYPHVLQNIEQEIQLVRKLNHKNIMKMIDVFRTERKIYIFMEYCAGVLKEIIDSAPGHRVPKWQSHHYFTQLIDGLKYLHSLGIYHRDIKDENLLLDNSHVIKIADFGVCYVSARFAENDLITGFEGTPLYRPPELLRDCEPNEFSGSKSDIWSAGVLLYQMISGTYPFFQNKESPMDICAYDHLKYPSIIFNDKQLLLLLQSIFIIDFNRRTTIKQIKDHPWVRLKHRTGNDIKIDFPVKEVGDIYRGLLLLERLRVRYEYQVKDESKNSELVNAEEYEESLKPKNPNTRSSRSPPKKQQPKKLTAIHRMNRMGFLATSD